MWIRIRIQLLFNSDSDPALKKNYLVIGERDKQDCSKVKKNLKLVQTYLLKIHLQQFPCIFSPLFFLNFSLLINADPQLSGCHSLLFGKMIRITRIHHTALQSVNKCGSTALWLSQFVIRQNDKDHSDPPHCSAVC